MIKKSRLLYLSLFCALLLQGISTKLEAQNTGRLTWGQVFSDTNDDCLYTNGELGLQGWTVRATETTTGEVMEQETGPSGFYEFFFLENTQHELTVIPPVDLTAGGCNTTVIIDAPQDTFIIDSLNNLSNFPITSITSECPHYMMVDVGGWRMRRCVDNTFDIQYCNFGMEDEEDVYIELTLDDFLSLSSSTIPVASQNGNVFTFDIGMVASGDCGSFSIEALVSCDAELGQTHCLEAHIFPDSICTPVDPLWSGASLQVKGNCNGDEVEFIIRNVGEGDMSEPVDFIVVEDHVITMQEQVPLLLSGEEYTVTKTANGSTYRLEVDQVALHPGHSMAESATVEACTEGSEFSTGFVTQLFENDDEPFLAELCMENRDSYDPNEKRAYPRGFDEAHYIEANTDLDYVIHFQNTGTDTAFVVRIEDQISELLNASSIRPGASSHPYTYTLNNDGLLTFLFEDIMLPDSNVNEAASNGYVNFRIQQQPNLPIGTVINNEAAIYFDFNDPIITNETFHKIGEDFIEVVITSVETELTNLKLSFGPNPFREQSILHIEGADFQEYQLLLFDLQGRLVKQAQFQSNTYNLHRSDLTNGSYFFQLHADGQQIATGKLMVQ